MRIKLSHPQKRIWYSEKSNPMTSINNIAGVMNLKFDLNIEKIQNAMNFLVKNNSALKLKFYEENGLPYQYVDKHIDGHLIYKDFSYEKSQYKQNEIWIDNRIKEPFDLMKDRLFRFDVLKISEGEYQLLLIMHHIISDGWTLHLFVKKLFEYYDNNTGNELFDYVDFIKKEEEYMDSVKFKNNKKYWNEKFKILPENAFKFSFETISKRIKKRIEGTLYNKILEEIKLQNLSLNTFFIAAKSIYDYRFTSKKDIVYGVPILNRSGFKMKNTIGMFTSTMPIRFQIDGSLRKEELYERIRRDFKQSLMNQRYPYDMLFDDLELRKHGYSGLFDTYINYYIAKSTPTYKGSNVTTVEKHTGEQDYTFQIIVEESVEGLTIYYDYKLDFFTDDEIEQLHEHLVNIIKQLTSIRFIQVKDIDMQFHTINKAGQNNDSSERKIVRDTVIDLFKSQVAQRKDHIAVYHENKSITYDLLDRMSNRFANYFVAKGISKGDKIGVILTHSIELIALLLGIHKVGACYVPIAPDYPSERIEYILKDSNVSLAITNRKHNFIFEESIITDIKLNRYSDRYSTQPCMEELAYIIYTSGSTGRPKGVMVTHRNLANYAMFAAKEYLKGENDIFAFYSSISFDLTVTSIFAPLICGKSLDVYYGQEGEFTLFDVLKRRRSNVIKLTPSHLRVIEDKFTPNTRVDRLILGGENLPTKLSKKILEATDKKIEIFNEYGPTETTVGCMLHKFDEYTDVGDSVPIGVAAAESIILILDEDLNIVPEGTCGEIYIGGNGVTSGYINKSDLTEKVFLSIKDRVFYKTGDYAKYLKNGAIEYIGRKDLQVKIRGHRIELEEVSNALLKSLMIKNAVVLQGDDGNLCAYLVANENYEISCLKDELRTYLPEYMIPVYYRLIEEIPLTINGKIDTCKLPQITIEKLQFVKPSNKMENILVQICEEILNHQQISMNNNFFELGGDSIKGIQIVSKLNDRGYTVKINDIMQSKDLFEISRLMRVKNNKIKAIQTLVTGANVETPMLRWFENQNFEDKNYYTQSVLLEVALTIEFEKIKRVLSKILIRHDIFRMNAMNGKWIYSAEEINIDKILEVFDFSKMSEKDMEENLLKESLNMKQRINIEQDLLIKCGYFQTCTKKFLLITIHHLAVDGISWRILLDELNELLIDESFYDKTPKKTSYKEWALALEEFRSKDQIDLDLWSNLNNVSFAVTPDSCEVKPHSNDSVIVTMPLKQFSEISQEVSEHFKLKTHEVLAYAAAKAVQNEFCQNEFYFEMEHHGRFDFKEEIDITKTVGWFTMMYPLPIQLDNADIKKDVVHFKDAIRTYEKKGYQYMLHHLAGYSSQQMYRFNYLGDFSNYNRQELIKLSDLNTGEDSSNRNLSSAIFELNCMIKEEYLWLKIDYNTGRFWRETIENVGNSFIDNIKKLENVCNSTAEVILSRSDFESLDISSEDFEELFY